MFVVGIMIVTAVIEHLGVSLNKLHFGVLLH